MPEANPTAQIPAFSLRLSCPKCFMQMVLTHSEPGKPGYDNLTFDCPKCGYKDNRAFKMPQPPTGVIEVQALLDDHPTGGRHSDVLAKAPAVLSESGLLRAEFDISIFPPSPPPGE